MPDAASLRQRVHGPAAVTAATPKTWDESKVKGYDPNYKFDESKVVRDKDPGEEGQFASKGSGGGGGSGESKSAARKRRKAAEAKRIEDWKAKLGAYPTVGARQVALNNAKEKGLEVEQSADGSAKITNADGSVTELPADSVYMETEEGRDEFTRYAISQEMIVEERFDGSGFVQTPWGGKIKLPPDSQYKVDYDVDDDKKVQASLLATATKDWKADKRQEAAKKGWALPDGSYPIKDKADWHKAKQALGRAKNRSAVVRHLRKRAKALGIPKSEVQALTAALGDWDEALHPRGRDGKWIEKFGFVSGLFEWFDTTKPELDTTIGKGERRQTTRAKVIGFSEHNGETYVGVRDEDDNSVGFAKASDIIQTAPPKADVTPEDVQQLSLADAPVTGPPGTRPDLGTPGMVKQNLGTPAEAKTAITPLYKTPMGPAATKHYAQYDADMRAGKDDYGRNAATTLSDDELGEVITELEQKIANGDKGMSATQDLKILVAEREKRANGGVAPPVAEASNDYTPDEQKRYDELVEDGWTPDDAGGLITDMRSLTDGEKAFYEEMRNDGWGHEEAMQEVNDRKGVDAEIDAEVDAELAADDEAYQQRNVDREKMWGELSQAQRERYNDLVQDGYGVSDEEALRTIADEAMADEVDADGEAGRLDPDLSTAPKVVVGESTYEFDEENWANAEVWRWDGDGTGEMIGRAQMGGDGKSARLVLEGETKPFPRTFTSAQELLAVAAELNQQRLKKGTTASAVDVEALRKRVHGN